MSKCVYICSYILNYQGNSKIQIFKNCIDQESNSGPCHCPCHMWSLTTRPPWHVICCSEMVLSTWSDIVLSVTGKHFCNNSFGGVFGYLKILKNFTKISNIYSDSNNLYQSILRGSEQFPRIFKSWILILRKLLIYQCLYIYVICYLWPYAMQ